jgi:hypothetical protein
MDRQITTRAEWTALGEPEPRLTVGEFTALLHAAAELERAGRPIVIRPSTETATTAHGAVDIPFPAAPVALAVAKPKERNPWALIFMTSACTGIGSCLVTAVTDDLISLVVTLAAFAVWGVATYNIVFKEQ